MLNDILTLKQIKEGNIKAFEEVFKLYYSPLCMYVAGITGRMCVAEEVVQELFYYFWKERLKIRILHSLKAYLYRAARNKALQYIEHQDVRSRYLESVQNSSPGSFDSPEQELEYKELESIINRVLQRFPERRRRIFRMHRLDGLKYAEIATELSVSVKTVEAEMTKALQSLRKEIDNYTRIA